MGPAGRSSAGLLLPRMESLVVYSSSHWPARRGQQRQGDDASRGRPPAAWLGCTAPCTLVCPLHLDGATCLPAPPPPPPSPLFPHRHQHTVDKVGGEGLLGWVPPLQRRRHRLHPRLVLLAGCQAPLQRLYGVQKLHV